MKNGVEVERPLKHRPDVIVVKSNGTRKVIGDGNGFTPAEFEAVSGGFTSSSQPLEYSNEEKQVIEKAEDIFYRARSITARLWQEKQELRKKAEQAALRNQSTEGYSRELQELERRLDDAVNLEQQAQVALTSTRQEQAAARRARLNGPPAPGPSLTERLEALE